MNEKIARLVSRVPWFVAVPVLIPLVIAEKVETGVKTGVETCKLVKQIYVEYRKEKSSKKNNPTEK